MSEKCPFCGAEEMEPWMGKYRTWTCHTQMGMNGDIDRHRDCYEAELSQLRGLLEEAVAAIEELLSGHDNLYKEVFRAFPNCNPENDIAAKAARAFIAKAKMKEAEGENKCLS